MTRKEATRLVADSGGRLCVRYVQLPGGGVLTPTRPRRSTTSRAAPRASRRGPPPPPSLGASVAAQTLSPSGRQAASGAEINVAKRAAAAPALETGGATLGGGSRTLEGARRRNPRDLSTHRPGDANCAQHDGEYASVTCARTYTSVSGRGLPRYEAANVSVRRGTSRVDATLQIGQSRGHGGGHRRTERAAREGGVHDDLAGWKTARARRRPNVLDRGIDSTALRRPSPTRSPDGSKPLLDAGAAVNAETGGRTALMLLDEDATPELVAPCSTPGPKSK